jgi:hypothetical protein
VFSRVVLLILLFDTNLDEHRVAVRREHLGFLLSETVRNPEEYTRKCRGFREAEGDLDRVAVAGAGGGQCLGVVGSGARRGVLDLDLQVLLELHPPWVRYGGRTGERLGFHGSRR